MGSTPVDEETSRICAAYAESDQRVYECPCPACGEAHQIKWTDIHWPEGGPASAYWACPSCGGVVEESGKAAFVAAGDWRATRPEVIGHHGYKLNALISTLPNAAWGKLAAEFLIAKRSPETLKPFVNTVLGEPWRDSSEGVEEGDLMARVESIGLDRIPAEVIAMTAGLDVQGDRIEMTTVGWTEDETAVALAHEIAWGDPLAGDVWLEVDDLLKRRFQHPLGGSVAYDAAFVDSGDGNSSDAVYAFCRPRLSRRIFAIKGIAGFGRQAVTLSSQKNIWLQIVAVDVIKMQIMGRFQSATGVRFGDTLGAEWFTQATAERIAVKYHHGRPVKQFFRISGRRGEAIDCLTYAFAARQIFTIDPTRRRDILSGNAFENTVATISRSRWLSGAT